MQRTARTTTTTLAHSVRPRRLELALRSCSLLVLATALTVLVGWAKGDVALQTLRVSGVTIKANTAIGLALVAMALLVAASRGLNARWRTFGTISAALAALLGALTLLQYLLGVDLGIDQLFVSAWRDTDRTVTPGRMSAVAAVLLVLLGLALTLDGWRPGFARASQLLALAAVAVTLTMLLAYVYTVIPLDGAGHGLQIALPTILSMLVLALGTLSLHPRSGWLAVVTSPGVGGITARRLLPVAFVVPVVMSAIRFAVPALVHADPQVVNAATAMFTMLTLAALIWPTATKLEEAALAHAAAENERTRMELEVETARARADAEREQREVVESANARAVTASREKDKVQEQLVHSQKMDAVGQLAGGVAHDFNNLLTVIRGNADFLSEELGADDMRRRYAEEIQAASDRAAALTRQLLTFSRKHIPQPKVLSVDAVVRGMQHMLRRLMPSNIELSFRLEAGDAMVRFDPGQLEQAVMNLAINARDAMPSGGHIAIASRVAQFDGTEVEEGVTPRSGENVVLEISDTGHGMTPEIRQRIFEPFFTTKPAGSGTGLGLSIVYGVVREHDGIVSVYSEPGHGTTFKVYLPAYGRAAAAQTVAARPIPRGNEVILLVDDDDSVRHVVRVALERFGYTVLDARDGEHALVVADLFNGLPDLLLTDLMMPKVTGRALVDELERLGRRPKVLLMSGYTDDEVVRRGLRDQRYAFIQKPFTQEALMRAVRDVLDGA